jgi:glycosyltransferase involved in cell wall biosynthesis/acetyltransferase-like isoleucine patch superfamily enzyme
MSSFDKLLTLAIPTYNRASTLDRLLCIIQPQLESACNLVEFIVSDNCSPDTTQETVQRYIDSGMKIKYIRNKTNIGVMLNIIQCYKLATAKYVWVMGDDDYLAENAVQFILDILKNEKSYGLLFCTTAGTSGYEEYDNPKETFVHVEPIIGWVSGNIINKKYIDAYNFDSHEYVFNTPSRLNFSAIIDAQYNVQVSVKKVFLSVAVASKSAGGYNYFKETAIDIATMNRHRKILKAKYSYYEKYKKAMFGSTLEHIENLFRDDDGFFETKGAWGFLFRCYWYLPYFYSFLIKCIRKYKLPFLRSIKNGLKFFIDPVSFIKKCVEQTSSIASEKKSVWRLINPHNKTLQAADFNHDNVFAGLNTTGELWVYDDINSGAVLRIGNNCSIGSNACFLLSGDDLEKSGFRGNITIGNNVMFGRNVVIYPGVHIADNTVILAGTIVRENID